MNMDIKFISIIFIILIQVIILSLVSTKVIKTDNDNDNDNKEYYFDTPTQRVRKCTIRNICININEAGGLNINTDMFSTIKRWIKRLDKWLEGEPQPKFLGGKNK